MDWKTYAATSPYQTAVAIRKELGVGHLDEAKAGLQELIDALSRSERRALRSQLIRLMTHLLKWKTQPERRSRGWSAMILNARDDIAEIRDETPSLDEDAIRALWDGAFAAAKRQAEGEMDRSCPIVELSWTEVFEEDYRDPA